MLINLSARRFGRLTVIERAENRSRRPTWRCRCDCGSEITALGQNLRTGWTQSCGCLSRERAADLLRKHGMSRTATYHVWENMIQRCTNPRNTNWRNYGGRGIRVCERWMTFENFLADMGVRPEGLTIERKDNDGDYEPANVKWATRMEQAGNTRRWNHFAAIP